MQRGIVYTSFRMDLDLFLCILMKNPIYFTKLIS